MPFVSSDRALHVQINKLYEHICICKHNYNTISKGIHMQTILVCQKKKKAKVLRCHDKSM